MVEELNIWVRVLGLVRSDSWGWNEHGFRNTRVWKWVWEFRNVGLVQIKTRYEVRVKNDQEPVTL